MNKLPIRLLGVLLTLAFFVFQGRAAIRRVDILTDEENRNICRDATFGDCSLRGAIQGATAGDTIDFSFMFDSPQTITINTSALTIDKNLTITGKGARLLTVQHDGRFQNLFAIFRITNGATVRISGMTLTKGTVGGIYNNNGTVTLDGMNILENSSFSGGGITNRGTMTVLNSLVSGNTAAFGAGIYNDGGTMSIANTTIANNTGTGGGSYFTAAGIDNNAGALNLNNVTIIGNINKSTNQTAAGGLYTANGTVNIRNTLISENTAMSSPNEDVSGTFISNGNNLVRDTTGSTGFNQPTDITNVQDGGLAALQDNGGGTDTRLPTMNSLAVNAGNNCVVDLSCGVNNPPVALTTDQRGAGFPRRSGVAVDIGAAEAAAPTAAGTTAGGRVTESNGRGIYRILITLTDSQGNQRQVYTNQQGYYSFEDVAGGQVYIFSAFHRRYQFEQPTQVQFIGEEETGINFIGSPSSIFRFDIWNLPTKRIE